MSRPGSNPNIPSGRRVNVNPAPANPGALKVRSYVPPPAARGGAAAAVPPPAFNVRGSRTPVFSSGTLGRQQQQQQQQLLDIRRQQQLQQQQRQEQERQEAAQLLYLTGPPTLDNVVLERLNQSYLWRQSFAATALRISSTTLLSTMRAIISDSNKFPPQVVQSESNEAIQLFFAQLNRGFRRVDLEILAWTRPEFQVYMTFRSGNTILRFHFIPQGDVLQAFLLTLFGSTSLRQVQDFVQYTSTRVGLPQLAPIGEPANTAVLISIRVMGEDWIWTWNGAPHTLVIWPPYSPPPPLLPNESEPRPGPQIVRGIVMRQPRLPNFRIVLNG